MISKYTYKGLTWIDLESPTEEELAHVVDFKSVDALHFIVNNDTLITSRRYYTPQIATFAKNFEMNIALDRPTQTETIDSLFFELLSFFQKYGEYNQSLQQKDYKISVLESRYNKMVKSYNNKLVFFQMMSILALILSLVIYIWY